MNYNSETELCVTTDFEGYIYVLNFRKYFAHAENSSRYLTSFQRSGDKYPSLSPSLR